MLGSGVPIYFAARGVVCTFASGSSTTASSGSPRSGQADNTSNSWVRKMPLGCKNIRLTVYDTDLSNPRFRTSHRSSLKQP